MAYAGKRVTNDIRGDDAMVLEQEETAPSYYDFSNPKPVAVGAAYKRSTIYAGPSSSFTSGQVMQFDIPTGTPGAMMDPSQTVLQFTIHNTSGQPLTLSRSAYSCIERIDAYHGSQMIASTGKAGLLHNVLLDFQSGASSGFSTGSMLGCADYEMPAAYAAADVESALYPTTGETIANNARKTVTLPLAYVFGALCGKAVPLSELHQGLRVDIHVANMLDFGVYDADPGTTSPTLETVKMQLGMVMLSDSAYTKMVRSLDRIYIPSMSYLHASHSVAANTSTAWQLPFRLASVNMIILAAVPNTSENAFGGDITTRTRAALTKWQLRIGSTLVPDQPVSATHGGAETRAELVRAFNALGIADYASRVSGTAFDDAAFCIAFNTSAFSQSDILFDGRRLDTEYAIFEADTNSGASFKWHAWALHDVMMEVSQNQLNFAI